MSRAFYESIKINLTPFCFYGAAPLRFMYFPGENTFDLDIAIERFRIQTNINKYKTYAGELNG
jgi:hypothetical protein